jgi:hypothetical protein
VRSARRIQVFGAASRASRHRHRPPNCPAVTGLAGSYAYMIHLSSVGLQTAVTAKVRKFATVRAGKSKQAITVQTSKETISGQSREVGCVTFHARGSWRRISLTQVALDVMSSTDWTFCGRSRTELNDERALACGFPTGIPCMRFALFLFTWRRSHDFVNRGRGERRVALPKTRTRLHECPDLHGNPFSTSRLSATMASSPLHANSRDGHLLSIRKFPALGFSLGEFRFRLIFH